MRLANSVADPETCANLEHEIYALHSLVIHSGAKNHVELAHLISTNTEYP